METGTMTPKDKVLEIYDNAKIWIMNENSPWPRYYVQYWDQSKKFEHLARRCYNEEEAWEQAWNTVQLNMIKKLEG